MDSKVIIAPLNWGLGHATRSIPVINAFISKNWEVILISDGDALTLLQKEFPKLKSYSVQGYNITYPYKNAILNMIPQLMKFWRGIVMEKKQLEKIVRREKPDLIISDNRYGMYNSSVKSVFIGHQISLKTGNSIISKLATILNKRMIRKFDELWIPDNVHGKTLAGELSEPIPGMNSIFIGPLSRFHRKSVEKKYELCVILSGPEPQRSIFETVIMDQITQLNEKAILILGRMDKTEDFMLNERTRVVAHMTGVKLNEIINQSRIVISRSGYSTIMDLVKLQKKAILIPTPGQPEQIYLAKYLEDNTNFIFQKQDEINIPNALEQLAKEDSDTSLTFEFAIDNLLL